MKRFHTIYGTDTEILPTTGACCVPPAATVNERCCEPEAVAAQACCAS
jgi:hypothetical protein